MVAAAGQRGEDGGAAVEHSGHMPGDAGIGGVEEAGGAGGAGRTYEQAFLGLAESGNEQVGIGGADGETREAEAEKGVVAAGAIGGAGNERPGDVLLV